MALSTDLRLDYRFFRFGRLMVLMAGDAIDPVLACLLLTQAKKIPRVSFDGKPDTLQSFLLPISQKRK